MGGRVDDTIHTTTVAAAVPVKKQSFNLNNQSAVTNQTFHLSTEGAAPAAATITEAVVVTNQYDSLIFLFFIRPRVVRDDEIVLEKEKAAERQLHLPRLFFFPPIRISKWRRRRAQFKSVVVVVVSFKHYTTRRSSSPIDTKAVKERDR